MRRIIAALVFTFLALGSQAQTVRTALTYPHLVVFGDNYSDTLNTYGATESTTQGYDASGNPITIFDGYPSYLYDYQDGQFTNGFNSPNGSTTVYSGVWHQQLHGLLGGVPLAAPALNSGVSTAGSTNYAWGSATTASGTTTVTFAGHLTVAVHNLNRQIDDYLNAGNVPDGKSLYVLFGGLNDLLTDSSTASATAAAANITAEAKRLIDGGAVNLLVANVPGISANAASPIDVAAGTFRSQLAADLAGLQAQYLLQGKTVHLTTLDLYTLYANIFAAPASFGFTDVTDHANQQGANGYYPSNVDQYLNWDGVNPTTAGHHQIAIAACTALTGTVTTLAVDKALGTVASPSTLTAIVSTFGTYGPQSSATPTGTVTFYYPQTVLTTTTMIPLGTATLTGGKATFTTASLPPDTYTFYAVYNGDTNFPPGCHSNTLAAQVAVAATSYDFSFSVPKAYIGMEEGVAETITPMPIGGFTGPITFTCSNLPQFFACNFTNNQTVQVVGGGTVYYSQVFISSGTPTKAASVVAGVIAAKDESGKGLALAALLGAPFLLLACGSRRLRKPGMVLLTLLMAAGMMSLGGCAAASPAASGSTGNSDPGYGTTHGPGITYAAPGTYFVTVTGTSGNLSVSHQVQVYIADTFDVGVIP